jgi:nucleoside-diphosphate-sugar epimerase
MAKRVALVTGAGGEMGRALVPLLAGRGVTVLAVDLSPLAPDLARCSAEAVVADVQDTARMARLVSDGGPDRVYHLAAILSAHAERDPLRAHRVNVDATLGLLEACRVLSERKPVAFAFPSSIAVYGLGGADKDSLRPVREWERTEPDAAYGAHKLYCELVGSHAARRSGGRLDFRSIRFPGLVSAESLPSGGTTDYAPSMVHAAARGEPYVCFVAERSRLPFLTMPDAVEAFERLLDAPAPTLTRRVYNARGFSASAGEIAEAVRGEFPRADLRFEPVPERQAIVDSWPADVDDRAARADWGFAPRHDLDGAIRDYLAPALRRRHAAAPHER